MRSRFRYQVLWILLTILTFLATVAPVLAREGAIGGG